MKELGPEGRGEEDILSQEGSLQVQKPALKLQGLLNYHWESPFGFFQVPHGHGHGHVLNQVSLSSTYSKNISLQKRKDRVLKER